MLCVEFVPVDHAIRVVVVVLEVRVDAVGVRLVAVDLHLVRAGGAVGADTASTCQSRVATIPERGRAGGRAEGRRGNSLITVDIHGLPVPLVAPRQAEVLILGHLAVAVGVVKFHPRGGFGLHVTAARGERGGGGNVRCLGWLGGR